MPSSYGRGGIPSRDSFFLALSQLARISLFQAGPFPDELESPGLKAASKHLPIR